MGLDHSKPLSWVVMAFASVINAVAVFPALPRHSNGSLCIEHMPGTVHYRSQHLHQLVADGHENRASVTACCPVERRCGPAYPLQVSGCSPQMAYVLFRTVRPLQSFWYGPASPAGHRTGIVQKAAMAVDSCGAHFDSELPQQRQQ